MYLDFLWSPYFLFITPTVTSGQTTIEYFKSFPLRAKFKYVAQIWNAFLLSKKILKWLIDLFLFLLFRIGKQEDHISILTIEAGVRILNRYSKCVWQLIINSVYFRLLLFICFSIFLYQIFGHGPWYLWLICSRRAPLPAVPMTRGNSIGTSDFMLSRCWIMNSSERVTYKDNHVLQS